MALTAQQHQGLHGEGYLFAMASSAGLLASRPAYDVDGVDWLVCRPGRHGSVRSPKAELQVKTWSNPSGDPQGLQYRLRTPNFNALAGPGFSVPRFLILVTVPSAVAGYAVCDSQCMKLAHAAYWLSLADRQPIPEGPDQPGSVVVTVPSANLLTPKGLVALVGIGDGEAGS